MMHGNMWMVDGIGRGGRGMWAGHMGGDFDMFGPVSLITVSIFSVLFLLAVIWTVAIKGYALWTASKRNEKWWFIALLIINTFGILEIVYLVFFAKLWGKKAKDSAEVGNKTHAPQTTSATGAGENKI